MRTPKVDNPLNELKTWLVESATRCRAMRWFGALFRVEVAQDIVGDVEEAQREAAQAAYSSEQYDLSAQKELDEARTELEAALKAETIDAHAILSAVRRMKNAHRMVSLSAEKDHDLAEKLSPCTC